jgi:hypothetical protein
MSTAPNSRGQIWVNRNALVLKKTDKINACKRPAMNISAKVENESRLNTSLKI